VNYGHPPPPSTPPGTASRIHAAVAHRAESDYVFDFWTALGWTLLTCGVYMLYVLYRLVWRSVQHNRRRIELLEATNAWAWDKAVAAGRGDELTPAFQRVSGHLSVLRRIDGEFRDPGLWLLLGIVASGIATYVAYVLLDGDLVDHEAGERAAEAELSGILSVLGAQVQAPPPPTKQRHNWVGRVLATLGTCGIYGFWWLADMMRELNEHYRGNWWWEDQLVGAVRSIGE
jgi:hypothetical protein